MFNITVKVFFKANSQVTFTLTVCFSGLPKPLYAVQVNIPASILLTFVIVSTFPSCTTTAFPWFPGFSLVQVMFGSGLPDASQLNCKLLPSRTVGSPLIPVVFVETKSNQTITSKLQGYLNDMYMYKQHTKVIIKTVNMISKCSLQTLHMQMKFTCYDCANYTFKNNPWIIIYYMCFNLFTSRVINM